MTGSPTPGLPDSFDATWRGFCGLPAGVLRHATAAEPDAVPTAVTARGPGCRRHRTSHGHRRTRRPGPAVAAHHGALRRASRSAAAHNDARSEAGASTSTSPPRARN